MHPKVTILIPTYNRSAFLREAVRSAMRQTYDNLEIVVSDNASTDDTEGVMRDYLGDPRVKFYRNETNLGMVGNWNKAVREHCAGEWFLILSDDDFLTDDEYVARAVELISRDRDIRLVYANATLHYEATGKTEDLSLPFREIEDGPAVFISRGNTGQLDFALCTVIFNRGLAIELKAFSNLHCVAADSELFLKSCLCGKVGFIKRPAAVYRFHGENLIANFKKDTDLILGYLDWCVQPYRMALEKSLFTSAELAAWRKRNILGEFASVYKGVLRYHKRRYFPLTRELLLRGGISTAEFIGVNLKVVPELILKALPLLLSRSPGILAKKRNGPVNIPGAGR